MGESEPIDEAVDLTFYRRALVVAFAYAVIDLLVVFVGRIAVPFRLIGVVVAYFVIKDMIVLREAGVEWGWTRYVVLVVAAVGGFLGFAVYAWRRNVHLQNRSVPDSEPSSTAAGEPEVDAGEGSGSGTVEGRDEDDPSGTE